MTKKNAAANAANYAGKTQAKRRQNRRQNRRQHAESRRSRRWQGRARTAHCATSGYVHLQSRRHCRMQPKTAHKACRNAATYKCKCFWETYLPSIPLPFVFFRAAVCFGTPLQFALALRCTVHCTVARFTAPLSGSARRKTRALRHSNTHISRMQTVTALAFFFVYVCLRAGTKGVSATSRALGLVRRALAARGVYRRVACTGG